MSTPKYKPTWAEQAADRLLRPLEGKSIYRLLFAQTVHALKRARKEGMKFAVNHPETAEEIVSGAIREKLEREQKEGAK